MISTFSLFVVVLHGDGGAFGNREGATIALDDTELVDNQHVPTAMSAASGGCAGMSEQLMTAGNDDRCQLNTSSAQKIVRSVFGEHSTFPVCIAADDVRVPATDDMHAWRLAIHRTCWLSSAKYMQREHEKAQERKLIMSHLIGSMMCAAQNETRRPKENEIADLEGISIGQLSKEMMWQASINAKEASYPLGSGEYCFQAEPSGIVAMAQRNLTFAQSEDASNCARVSYKGKPARGVDCFLLDMEAHVNHSDTLSCNQQKITAAFEVLLSQKHWGAHRLFAGALAAHIFRPVPSLAKFAADVKKKIGWPTEPADYSGNGRGLVLGMHIRRGDASGEKFRLFGPVLSNIVSYHSF
jgi:hypothetical protein